MTQGGFHCMYVIILVNLLGLRKLSNALGIVILVQGMASFVGPPTTVLQKHMSPEQQNDTDDDKPELPDGGWGWVVVFATFMMNSIIWGILNTSGVIYVELLEDLQTGKGQTAWISSLAFGTLMSISPVSSALSNAYGNRCISIMGSLVATAGFIVSGFAKNIYFLYISLGIGVGAGFGLSFLPFLVCLNQYFKRRRSFAVGLSACGSGVGTFVWAPIVELLIGKYGWRGTTLVLAGASLNIVVLGCLLRPLNIAKYKYENSLNSNNRELKCVTEDMMLKYKQTSENKDSFDVSLSDSYKLLPPQNQANPDNENVNVDNERVAMTNGENKEYFGRAMRHFDFSVLRNVRFLIFLLSNFTIMLGINAPYVYLPDRSREKGISKTDSAILISIIGVANTMGRIIFGWLADRKCVNPRNLYTVSMVVCGTVTVLNPFSDSYIYLMFYSAVYGCFMGAFSSLYITILVDLVGLRKLSNALGLVLMVRGIASFIGTPTAGWLYDSTGSYNTSFYGTGAVIIMGGLFICFI